MPNVSRAFVDTNILLYALDRGSPAKNAIARKVLEDVENRQVVLSAQVLSEFYFMATRKFRVQETLARQLVDEYAEYEVVFIDPALIKEAIDCSILEQLSYWDALILAAAARARCEVLLTEDLNHGQVIRGVRIENPFKKTAHG
jgi:predicted nucleic acid-binding protein